MKKIRTSGKGRQCKYPHCKQILNIYNHEIYCHVHLGKVDLKEKTKAFK